MNNKGFAIMSMVYASLILLSLTMFGVLMVLQNEYENQKRFGEDIENNLSSCIADGDC